MTKDQFIKISRFQKAIWDFYNKNKRDALPWRKKITPYRIWVSEIMLQQTQIDRVVPFFNTWMKLFPSSKKLAKAPQSEILRAWKGLGYNSRALRMKKTAEMGNLPKTYNELLELPGIGSYTAAAICTFAYNQPVVMIETNIRRVFIHHFFQNSTPNPSSWKEEGNRTVHDRDILKLIEQTLPENNFREWYWALMDYGSYLGKTIPNSNKRSRHYTIQKRFKGSDREIRGKVLEILLEKKKMSLEKIIERLKALSDDQERIEKIIDQLDHEGFLTLVKGNVILRP